MFFTNNVAIPNDILKSSKAFLAADGQSWYRYLSMELNLVDGEEFVLAKQGDKYYLFNMVTEKLGKLYTTEMYLPKVLVKRTFEVPFEYPMEELPRLYNSEEMDIIKDGNSMQKVKVCKFDDDFILWQDLDDKETFVMVRIPFKEEDLLKTMRRL